MSHPVWVEALRITRFHGPQHVISDSWFTASRAGAAPGATRRLNDASTQRVTRARTLRPRPPVRTPADHDQSDPQHRRRYQGDRCQIGSRRRKLLLVRGLHESRPMSPSLVLGSPSVRSAPRSFRWVRPRSTRCHRSPSSSWQLRRLRCHEHRRGPPWVTVTTAPGIGSSLSSNCPSPSVVDPNDPGDVPQGHDLGRSP